MGFVQREPASRRDGVASDVPNRPFEAEAASERDDMFVRSGSNRAEQELQIGKRSSLLRRTSSAIGQDQSAGGQPADTQSPRRGLLHRPRLQFEPAAVFGHQLIETSILPRAEFPRLPLRQQVAQLFLPHLSSVRLQNSSKASSASDSTDGSAMAWRTQSRTSHRLARSESPRVGPNRQQAIQKTATRPPATTSLSQWTPR